MLTEMLTFGVGGTLPLVAAIWLVARFATKSSAVRSSLWRAALVMLWLIPGAVLVRGMLPVEPVTIHIPVAAPTAAGTPPLPAQGPSSAVAPETPVANQASVASRPDANPLTALPWLWAAGSLVGALLILRDIASGWRAVKRATELDEGPILGAVTGLAQRFGLARVPHAARSAHVPMPAVFGMTRPVLLVPEGFDLTSPGADAVLAHELAHIRRHDFLVRCAARATLALLWWHPAAWIVCRCLATSAEEACDDWAIALTGSRRPYADSLLHWAEAVCAAGGLACQFRGRDLIRRVQRTLAGKGVPTVNVSGKAKIALLVCTIAVAAAVGILHIQTVAASSGPSSPDDNRAVSISGRLVGPDGHPVAGASVVIVAETAPPEEDTTGGAEASCEVQPGGVLRLTGAVYLGYGHVHVPLADAEGATALGYTRDETPRVTAVSDERGAFQVDGLLKGHRWSGTEIKLHGDSRMSLNAMRQSSGPIPFGALRVLVRSSDGGLWAFQQVDWASDTTATVGLAPLTSATGRVAGPDGTAIEGAEVRAMPILRTGRAFTHWAAELKGLPPLGSVTTDANGSWTIDGLIPGAPYVIVADAPGLTYDARRAELTAEAGRVIDTGTITPAGHAPRNDG